MSRKHANRYKYARENMRPPSSVSTVATKWQDKVVQRFRRHFMEERELIIESFMALGFTREFTEAFLELARSGIAPRFEGFGEPLSDDELLKHVTAFNNGMLVRDKQAS